jgi:glycine oxidase
MDIFGTGTLAADVAIVGGGVIGLTIARALNDSRARVAILERGEKAGAESSSAAAGMLAPQAEADSADIFFELACASRDLYQSFAASLREETGIDIELERSGTLYLAFTDEDVREIEKRFQWQKRAGLSVEKLTSEEARRLEPCISPHVRAALRFPLDTQVENRLLVDALAASIANPRVQLLTGITVKAVRINAGQVEGLETSEGFMRAPIVVLASGAWTTLIEARDAAIDKDNTPPLQIEPVRGQMLCYKTERAFARHVLYSPRGYLVPRLNLRVLAGSTTERAGFDKRVTDEGVRAITAHAQEIARDSINAMKLFETWAGLRPHARDSLPVIGAATDRQGLYYATGHYRNGILLAPITGQLIADLIVKNVASPLLQGFSPDRFRYANAC